MQRHGSVGSPEQLLERLQAAARRDEGDFLAFEIRPDREHPEIQNDVVIRPPKLRIHPLETHIAEKFHAHTLPRTRPNTRVKDLPDLVLLASARSIVAPRLAEALAQTFAFRSTHALPSALPSPPPAWDAPYAAMARDDELPWATLREVTEHAKAFLDPILAGETSAEWDPDASVWNARRR